MKPIILLEILSALLCLAVSLLNQTEKALVLYEN